MTFVSYAQNLEDVMLWRALRHVENGFYIDVGASDPEEDSVTKAFYDRGWRGINIEPVREYHQRLIAERPRDINLVVAAGESDGELVLFDVPAVRGWTSPDAAVAQAYRDKGFEVSELKVPVRTLAGICEEHVKGDIHFLKIDVECFETEVIRGMDFRKWRPWILVVEATLPNSRISNHHAWEFLLTESRYRFAYFDGLNRYYLAEEHTELAHLLATQPHVFDDFQTIAQARAQEAERDAETKAQHLQAQVNAIHGQLQDVLASTSWKITAPLRSSGRAIIIGKDLARQAVASPRGFARRCIIALLRRAVQLIRRSPLLAESAWRIYTSFPVLCERVMRHLRSSGSTNIAVDSARELRSLSDAQLAWTESVSRSTDFKDMLSHELRQRQTNGSR
jgi:FkbM family methyltransferase